MRAFKIYTIMAILILLFAGCTNASMDTVNKIVPPQNDNVPIQGNWVIDRCLSEDTSVGEAGSGTKWLEKTAWFTGDGASLGENTWSGVNYKTKRVSSDEYFLHKYSGTVSKLGIMGKELIVITLSASDKFLYEFIQINDAELIVNIDGEYFHLSRTLKNLGKLKAAGIGESEYNKADATFAGNGTVQSGAFIGIRRLAETKNVQNGSLKDYKYLTLWIASYGSKIGPILQADGIFLPRMSGFWKFQIEKISSGAIDEDTLNAFSVSGGEAGQLVLTSIDKSFWKNRTGTLIKAINFIGNDYVSIEYSGQGTQKAGEDWEMKRLATLPLDNLSNEQGVKLSEITGENGSLAVDTAVNDLLNISNIKKLKKPELSELERNFSLYRKAGHWFIKGRLEMPKGGGIPYTDYNINLIPPQSLVAYDDLLVPWTYIKDKIPDAVDAYTSPNRDIALIITKTMIEIYRIEGEVLAEKPMAKVSLQDGDTVIMAEWGLGDYTDKWEKAFCKYNTAKPSEMVK